MDKISGIILDVYDDLGGSVLKTIFPTADTLPEFVKSAHAISFDERSALPDDAFALILEQGGIELKKFATIDAGNTALSVEYFLKTAHKLPVEAQKVAAQNLVAACGWYDIDPPEELQKVAATGVERLGASMEEVGHDWEGKGKTMRNVGYGGAVGLGAGSFMPKSKAVRVAMRVGAAAGALGGYVGEGGIRSGRGYQRAGREMQGLPVNQHDVAGFHYSPAAYNEAHRSGEAQRKFDALNAEHTEAKKKVAFGVATALNLMEVPGAVGETRSNQRKQRAFQSQTGTIATPNQLARM